LVSNKKFLKQKESLPLQGIISMFNNPASFDFRSIIFACVLIGCKKQRFLVSTSAVPSWVGVSGDSKNGS